MVFGDYPCCGGPFSAAVPDRTPAFFREACPHCGAFVWHKLSRVDPESWTEADFLAEHDVDPETREIAPKAAAHPPPVDFLIGAFREWGFNDDAIDHEALAKVRAMCDEPADPREVSTPTGK